MASAAMLALLLAACGTTVPLSEEQKIAGPEGTTSSGQAGLGIDQGLGASTAPGSAGSNGTVPLGTSAPGPGNFSSGSGPAIRVPGVTATSIYVGLIYQTDQSSANAATFGNGNLDTGDARNYYNVLIRDINAHGGIAGRRVVPFYAEVKVTSTDTVDSQLQAACDTWTKDNKHSVFAILDGTREVLQQCAKKAGAVEFAEVTGTAAVPETFTRYPTYIEISGLNLVRQGPVTLEGLARQGYFDPGSRIGIVTWDDANHREAVQKGYVPALRARGLSLATEPSYTHVPQNVGDLGGTSADISGAVLRFNSLNINHVLILDGAAGLCGVGCLTALFTRQAQGQQYRPRYGLNENNAPQVGLDEGLYPPEQFRRAVAVLWDDTEAAADQGVRPNALRNRCLAFMKKHGIVPDNPNARATAVGACGEMWFMQLVVGRIGGQLTVGGFMAAVNGLGSFADPTTYGTFLSASQHDGVAAARNARFVESCSCFRYTTAPYRV